MENVDIKHSLGSYLLEFAVTIPFILTFAIGTFDVSRYLQAKEALDTATKAATRCLYATDGDCTAIVQGSQNMISASQHIGAATFQALVPGAKLLCSGPHCLELSVQESGDFVETSASYELPLLILGHRGVLVRSRTQERLERVFAKY